MLLQIALDKPEHLALLPQIRHIADIVEIGTPLLKRFGIGTITHRARTCARARQCSRTAKRSTAAN